MGLSVISAQTEEHYHRGLIPGRENIEGVRVSAIFRGMIGETFELT